MKIMKSIHKIIIPLFSLFVMFFLLSNSPIIFASGETDKTSNNSDVFYAAKFVCGSIEDGNGPLRPGHYDTSISILNKQISNSTFFWNVSTSDGKISHSTLISLDNFQSTNLDCRDIKRVSGITENIMAEGFVLITIPQRYNPAQPSELITPLNNSNGLEVQVFYTANALDTLPHKVVFEKISFYIIHDDTGKVPEDLIKTTLDVTLESHIDKISNTNVKIKKILAQEYGISNDELEMIQIRIKDVSIGVGSMIDDHAISLNILKPQISPTLTGQNDKSIIGFVPS